MKIAFQAVRTSVFTQISLDNTEVLYYYVGVAFIRTQQLTNTDPPSVIPMCDSMPSCGDFLDVNNNLALTVSWLMPFLKRCLFVTVS